MFALVGHGHSHQGQSARVLTGPLLRLVHDKYINTKFSAALAAASHPHRDWKPS